MFKKLLLILALAAFTMAANAQVTSHELGYCEGKVKIGSTDGFSITAADQDVSAAIFIPASTAGMYAGCEIARINAGLASTLNVESLTVWIRTALEAENLVQQTVTKTTTPKMEKGWNYLDLETPYTIPADTEGFYIGLTFHQKGNSVGLSVVQDLPVVENSLWVKLGNEAEWTDRSEEGILAIEGVVTGENLPKVNLQLKSVSLQPTVSLQDSMLYGSVNLLNKAEAVTGFDIIATVDDMEQVYTQHVDLTLDYKETASQSFSFCIEGLPEGSHTLHVTIANITEGADADPSDNSGEAAFAAVALFYPRNVLVEKFTTEGCSNCPRVAGYMHEMLETEGQDGSVNAICHHAGFGTDWLTIPADRTYTWLYGPVGVFAPAIIVDRYTADYLPGYENNSSIMLPMSAEELSAAVAARKAVPSYVYLDIDVELTDGNAHVKVSGQRATEVFSVNAPRIVVGLVEDNIPARNQAGLEEGQTYIQQHVNRAYNAIWGEYLTFEGNEYSYECDLPLKEEYVKENLSVVAYIWDYDPSDADKCEVCNSNSIVYSQMTDNTSGVSIVDAESAVETQFYTLDGVRIPSPRKGVNIVRTVDAKGNIQTLKVVM